MAGKGSRGGGSGSNELVKKLTEQGFSKTKALQALKDSGNSYPVALRILQRQQEEAERAKSDGKPSTTGASATTPNATLSTSAAITTGEGLEEHCGTNDAGGSADYADTGFPMKPMRTHPCIVQYKRCQFGDYCALRDYPGDTCINYFNGSCLYGSACRRRHYVDGVDIREGMRPTTTDTATLDDGRHYRVVGVAGDKVQIAQVVNQPDSRSVVLTGTVVPPPPSGADYNRVRGSEPSYTDPESGESWRVSVPSGSLPKPFLDKVKQGVPAGNRGRGGGGGQPSGQESTGMWHVTPSQPEDPPLRVTAGGDSGGGSTNRNHSDGGTQKSGASPAPRTAGRRTHPCVAQFGSCKFGDYCQHADRDADVCVFFLNGKCRFAADTCKYRHETEAEYHAKLCERFGDPLQTTASATLGGSACSTSPPSQLSSSPPPVASGAVEATTVDETFSFSPAPAPGVPGAPKAKPTKQKNRLQSMMPRGSPLPHPQQDSGNGSGGMAGGGGHHRTGVLGPLHAHPETYVDSDAPIGAFPGRPASYHGGGEDEDYYHYNQAQDGPLSRPAPMTAAEFFPVSLTEAEGELANDDDPVTAANPQSERELQVFLQLLEVFAEEDPLVVLQALRNANGDSSAAADALSKVEAMDPLEGMDATFARVLADEEEQEQREASAQQQRLESLLTLCSLFPSMEPATIDAVLRQNYDSFADAYGVLLCSQENITRSDYGNFWSGNVNPAENLRLEKLCAMFPDFHPDIVRSTFGAAEKNAVTTAAALNALTTELLSLQTREELGHEVTRWRPHETLRRQAEVQQRQLLEQQAQFKGIARTECPAGTTDDFAHAYREAEREAREYGDWRRVRERAYRVNACRIRVLSLASAAFLRGDGRVAKLLSREGKDLGSEYARLNRLAMLALEHERLSSESASTLDLHGFHVKEAIEVLCRRVDLCVRKRIRLLTVVMGEGRHSKRGQASIYPAVMEELKTSPYLTTRLRITSVRPGFVEARVIF